MAAVGCYTLRGRCVCVFGMKCGDLCGSEDVVARGEDWHSDAGRKCKKPLVRTLEDINANKKALAGKKKTGLKAYNNEAVATVTKLIVQFSLIKCDLRGIAIGKLGGLLIYSKIKIGSLVYMLLHELR